MNCIGGLGRAHGNRGLHDIGNRPRRSALGRGTGAEYANEPALMGDRDRVERDQGAGVGERKHWADGDTTSIDGVLIATAGRTLDHHRAGRSSYQQTMAGAHDLALKPGAARSADDKQCRRGQGIDEIAGG